MYHSPPRNLRMAALFALLLVALAATFALRSPIVASAVQSDPVTAAWEKAKASGGYRFASDIVQVTVPSSSKVTNIGRSSRSEEIRLEGETNLAERTMQMQFWSGAGSVLQAQSGTSVKVENGKTFVRQSGGEWTESDSLTDGVAPQGDFMGFLHAVRDVKTNALEWNKGIAFTRYSFTLDGEAFALFVRNQMEEVMRSKGELPAGMNLSVSDYYRKMVGSGELWVAENGLPLRQILTLQFPEQNDETVNAQIKVDFSNFGTGNAPQSASSFNNRILQVIRTIGLTTQNLGALATLLMSLGLVAFVLRYHRLRKLQHALSLAVILSLFVGPALSTIKQVQFLDAVSAKAAAQDEREQEADAQRELQQADATVDFNPHEDPIAAANQQALAQAELAGRVAGASLGVNAVSGINAVAAIAPLPSGATNWWTADGLTNDLLGGRNGTLNGSVGFAAGKVGQAFSFNGSNSYVALPDNFFPFPTTGTSNAPFTLELWFKTTANGVIFGQQNGKPHSSTPTGYVPAIYVDTAGKLRVLVFWKGSSSQIVSANTVNNGTFQHLAVTYANSSETVYLNGALLGSAAHVQTAYATNYNYQWGTGYTPNWPGGNNGWFNFKGLIDEPTIYNRALSQTEVQAIYNAGSDGKDKLKDSGLDSDSDGLSNFVELRLGTDPTFADSDEDGLTDGQEVKAISFGGKNWYSNPLKLDSIGDGMSDGMKWDGVSAPKDSDTDGVPDLFDADIDNDGVPNSLDSAPFTASSSATPYSNAAPLKLTIKNLVQDKPTFVEFQLRPKDSRHLWFAFNVLDWPKNDTQGQIQDVDGATWASVAAAQGRTVSAAEDNGDMKLVPMLEIRTPTASANLPSRADLTAYNIFTTSLTADGSQTAIYVPLTLISDNTTGNRVAFGGRMLYKGTPAWATSHDVRLAWVVQALVDIPCDPKATDAAAIGCAADAFIHNQAQPIQTYYDDWTLTGMSVREDNGAGMAVIYDDPTIDTNLYDDGALWQLVHGLDNSFLAGRDADKNNVRDVDLNEVVRRFDRLGNAAVPATQRWEIPNTLRVEKKDYPTFDQAVIYTAMTDTMRILNSQFAPRWSSANNLMPTLLFATEDRARTISLDGVTDGYVSLSGGSAIFDMAPTGKPAIATNITAGVKWAHYCSPAGSSASWAECKIDSYFDELAKRYPFSTPMNIDSSIVLPPANTQEVVDGQKAVMQMFDLTLQNGIRRLVQSNATPIYGRYTLKDDQQTTATVRLAAAIGQGVVPAIANIAIMARFVVKVTVWRYLAAKFTDFKAGAVGQGLTKLYVGVKDILVNMNNSGLNRLQGTAVILGAATVIAGLATAAYFLIDKFLGGDLGAAIAVKALKLLILDGIIGVVLPALGAASLVSNLSSIGLSRSTALMSASELTGTSKWAGAIGAAIGVAVTWGFFAYSMISGELSASDPAFGKVLAETIATTIFIILSAVIAATVIGSLIMAIIGLIDGILTAACELDTQFNGDSILRKTPGLGGACFTLGTTAIKVIAYFLYNFDTMVDLSREDLAIPGPFKRQLADPTKGYVSNNALSISLPITTYVAHKSPDPSNGLYIYPYLWLFSQDNLKSSTIQYSLTQSKSDLNVARNAMTNQWTNVVVDHYLLETPMYGATANSTATLPPLTFQPGLNRSTPLYFNMGYNVPAYECFPVPIPIPFVPPIPVCHPNKDLSGNTSTKLDSVIFDILPDTLDGFMAMASKTEGFIFTRTGFAQSWDPAFRIVADADGDGLRSSAFGGLDINDNAFDSDNDGLADSYEMQQRQNGIPFSLTACDTDADGLSDLQESQMGTNPNSPDSDNDGMKDGDEVWHRVYNGACQPTNAFAGGWDITINGVSTITTHVSSNPLMADSDGDNIDDLAERQLATKTDKLNRTFHPLLPNIAPISIFSEVSDADRFVRADQSLLYTTTIIAEVPMMPSILEVSYPPALGVAPAPYAVNFNPGAFTGTQSVVQTTNIVVARSGFSTPNLAITSKVRGRLSVASEPYVWDAFTPSNIGPFTPYLPRAVQTAPNRGDLLNPYVLNVLTSDSNVVGGKGQVRNYVIPTLSSTLLADALPGYNRSVSRPSMACNNAGNCLVLWDNLLSTGGPGGRPGSSIVGALVRSDGTVIKQLPGNTSFFDPSFAPVVASNGTGFLVAYESALFGAAPNYPPVSRILEYVLFDGNGALVGTSRPFTSQTPYTNDYTTPQYTMDVAWLGDRYRIAWRNLGSIGIGANDVDANGALLGSTLTLAGDAAGGRPSLAYDALTGRWAFAYLPTNSTTASVKVFANSGSTTPIASKVFAGGQQLDVVFYPQTQGWLLASHGADGVVRLQATDKNLSDIATQVSYGGNTTAQLNSLTNDALACPAMSSLPTMDVRFEDQPGSSTFVDSSGRGNNLICDPSYSLSCPVVGVPGATDASNNPVGSPPSDLAVTFNRDNQLLLLNSAPALNDFTIAFWFKMGANSSIQKIISSNGNTILDTASDFTVQNNNGALQFFVGNNLLTRVSSPTRVDDNKWHFAVLTRSIANNATAMYLDGTAVATQAGVSNGVQLGPKQWRVGGVGAAFFKGSLDQLQLYSNAFSATAARQLYDRTLQPYCLSASIKSDGANIQWAKLSLRPTEKSGGMLTVSNTLTVTVDGDPPVSTLKGLVDRQYVLGSKSTPRTLVIGGDASDPTSGIARVFVTVNQTSGGTPKLATGTSTWAYPLQVTEGAYRIQVAAVDNADIGQPSTTQPNLLVFADGSAPQLTVTPFPLTVFPSRTSNGQWSFTLSGTAKDPVMTPYFGSGIASVELQLVAPNGVPIGSGWQQATLVRDANGDATWSITISFPVGASDPTGNYTLMMRASDNVGNRSADSAYNRPLAIDVRGPNAVLTQSDVAAGVLTSTITTPVTLGGVMTDTGDAGVNRLEVAFVPITQVIPLKDTLLLLPFDEPNNVKYYSDRSGQLNDASCVINCPVSSAGQNSAGQNDGALTFNDTRLRLLEPNTGGVRNSSYTLHAVVKPTNGEGQFLSTSENATLGYSLGINLGKALFSAADNGVFVDVAGGPNLLDGKWHDVVASVDRAAATATLYVDGVAIGTQPWSGGRPIGGEMLIGRFAYQGAIDEVAVYGHALSAAEVQAIYQASKRQWLSATVSSRAVPASSWTIGLPAGLEGLYQIDLRAVDANLSAPPPELNGNSLLNGNVWRGVIDVVAPRVAISGTATGQSVLDANNVRQYEVTYTCLASDWQLDESTFDCPGNAIQPASRGFNTDSILQSEFPTLTILSTMSNTWTVWQESNIPSGTLTACDATGKCATATLGGAVAASAECGMRSAECAVTGEAFSVAAAEVAAVPSEQPNAEIVNPTDGSFVGSAGTVEVTVAAEAARTLKEVAVLLDGEVVATIPFARIDKMTIAQQSVSLAMSPGKHTLEAIASDWAGNQQSAGTPVRFTLVVKEPTVALGKTNLTLSDTYQAQSGIVLLQGTVDNTENLATVQVKVGDQPYADALIKNGIWGIAYPVVDPEDGKLAVSVRAIDKAGQITKIGADANTPFDTVNPPETTITSRPGNGVNTSINFTGTVGKGEAAFAFECKLDEGAFTVCRTPVEYKNLSNGEHTFRVHAINGQGIQDPTPAEVKWSVKGGGVVAKIGNAPAAETSSRSASFELNGGSEYECSLDGAAFTACTSPATYSKLSDGTHVFLVRVKGNPASKFTWKVTNSAPLAASQVLTTAQNSSLPVTLQASDESSLKFTVVSKPANGSLSGTGANLTYQPATDFFGTDSFTFKADDGDATSNLATVTINITPTPGQSGVERGNFVVFGSEGVILRENVKVMSGDVAASLSSNGPWLGDGAEVSIGKDVSFADAASKVMGDSLFVGQGTTLHDANFNELRGPGAVNGTKVTPQALPLLNRFVAMPAIGVGKQNVDVASNAKQTVQPGSYTSLNVGTGGEVTFTGGVYSFKEWNVADNTKLYFAAASEIRVLGRALVGMNSYVGPAPSSAVTAKQIVVYVAGVNANSAVLGGLGAKAATFGPYATLAANVVVPNGTLLIRERSKAVGSFVGRWVSVGKFSELTLGNRFSNIPLDGRSADFVSLTLDEATGLNSTAPLSADVDEELSTPEGSNEENPTATPISKVYLPMISSDTTESGTTENGTVDSETVGKGTDEEEAQMNMIFLPTVVR